MHAFFRSTALLAFGTATFSATGCPSTEIIRNDEHCANQGGNAFCLAFDSRFPFCGRGSCFPDDRDGCVAMQPEDACYSPCGGGMSLSDDPDQTCAGMDTLAGTDGTTSGSGTASTASEGVTTSGATTEGLADTSSTESESDTETSDTESGDTETGTTTGPIPCLDTACIDPRFPFCDPGTQRCAPCSTADEPDAACAALADGDRPFCADDVCVECLSADGCPDTDAPVCDDNACVACSAQDPGACAGTDTPVCEDNTCVVCSDTDPGACAQTDQVCFEGTCVDCAADDDCSGNTPVCDTEAHTCVACTADDLGSCGGNTPVCDVLNQQCAPCTSHAQCDALTPAAGPACDFATGACLSGGIVHVDGDEGCDDGEDADDGDDGGEDDGGEDAGSEPLPFCTLGAALQNVPEGATIILHELDEQNEYRESVTVAGPEVRVAILAAPGETPRIRGLASGPSVAVRNGAYLALDGVWIEDGLQAGVVVEQSTAYLNRVVISNNQQEGVRVDNGGDTNLIIRNSDIHGNVNHELLLNGGLTDIENSFIAHAITGQHAVNVGPTASLQMNYTTAKASTGTIGALFCTVSNEGRMIAVRNSILVKEGSGNPEGIRCPDADVFFSAFTGEFEEAVNGLSVEFSLYWFVDASTDLHLMSPEDFRNVAQWQPGDPTTDIDGDPRPTTPGPDFPGADVPAP